MINMNIEYYQYILKILHSGSISAAAKELYMSQPLLSQKLRQVESELNIVIFNRNTTPISLTFAGERFVKAAKKMIDIAANLQREIDEINGEVKGTLRIGISTHRAAQLLPKLLPRYLTKYPDVELKIIEYTKGKLSNAILEGQLDMAFVGYYNKNSDLEYVFLDDDRIALFAGPKTHIAHSVGKGTKVSIRLASQDRFVSVCEGHGFRESQDAVFQAYGMNPEIALVTHTIELACKLAFSCNYVALLPLTYRDGMRDEAKDAFYCYIDEEKESKRSFGLCYRRNAFLSKYMIDFVQMAKELYHVN